MADLQDSRVLVAGAAGALGEGIVAALLAAGAQVVAADRDEVGLARLGEEIGPPWRDALRIHPVDLCEEDAVVALVEEAEPWQGSVACLGGYGETGPLRTTDVLKAWRGQSERSLIPHLLLARHLLPRLVPGAVHLMIHGGTAEKPQKGAGLVSVAAAAQVMLTRVLAAEEAADGVAVCGLLLEGPVRSRKLTRGRAEWMDAVGVGGCAVRCLQAGADLRGRLLRADLAPALEDLP